MFKNIFKSFNKSDYIIIAIYFLVSDVMQIYDYIQRDALVREYWVDLPTQFITSLTMILLFLNWLIPSYIIKKRRFVLFAFWSLICMIILGGIDYTLGFWSGENPWKDFPGPVNFIMYTIDNTTENVGLLFALLLTKKFYEGQTQIMQIERQKKENELKLLRSQLDPHFLFNNLNTLDALIDSNPTRAKEYINRLSLIYRYLIKTKDVEVMELSEELELAENYIFLIETRFGKDYNFKIIKSAPIDSKFIPTGALQALLENVVKHNKGGHQKSIDATIEIGTTWISISNSKSHFKSNQESFGTGIENLATRYKLLSDKEIQIEDSKNNYKISIPIILLSSEQ